MVINFETCSVIAKIFINVIFKLLAIWDVVTESGFILGADDYEIYVWRGQYA